MKKAFNYKPFGKELEDFFNQYLISECGVSEHTIRSYRDAFIHLIDFFNEVKKINPDHLSLEHYTKENITDYLNWLEKNGNSLSTRNNRSAAIKSFAKYLVYSDPTHMAQWQAISSIKAKKYAKEMFGYMTIEEVALLLNSIDLSTSRGRRDHAILTTLYYTGARAQELAVLTPSSIRMSKPYIVELFGKGKKKRCVPLEDDVFNLLSAYMKENGLDRPECNKHCIFFNSWGSKLTTAGLKYIIDKYVAPLRVANPNIFVKHISPHSFRHSRAMHLLQAGVNLIIIRDILGHVSIQTTEIYARADSKLRRNAIANAYNSVGKVESNKTLWEKDPKLKAFLKGLV
ncbi:tyrosine-type recombinase/integrase [Bacteroides thetaiotaomicron]|uniref:tyrosine-type recombinase/integrase n=1 Tax=Bacteroides thetaiotaomicron TaxID=818 RepID=UPI004062836E